MSSGSSESGTLLSSSTPSISPSTFDQTEIDQPDRPIRFDEFARSVRLKKWLLALALPVALALEVGHLVSSIASISGNEDHGGQAERLTTKASIITDGVGIGLISAVILLFLATIIRPIHPPSSRSPAKHLTLHRSLCATLFSFLLACLVIHPLPSVVYIIFTHRAPPLPIYTSAFNLDTINNARIIAIVVAIAIGGSIRRGPELHYEQMRLATGFGSNEEVTQAPAAVIGGNEQGSENEEPVQGNVLDWSNSSMLAFVSLFYIWPLIKRSTQLDHLGRSDLPHLEQSIRQAGVKQMRRDADRIGLVKLDDMSEGVDTPDGAGKPKQYYTNWSLLKAAWSGRGRIVLSSLVLDAIRTNFGYLQIASMYELINTFSDPPGSDKTFARLMCWGLFVGQTVEVLLASYLWVRENYLLHLPSRMTLASILFTKILRTAEAQAMETHHESDEERAHGEARTQVLNLLTIDTGTVASLATIAPNVTNSIISLLIGIGFLYSMLGVSAFVGIACVPLSAPMSAYVAKNIYQCDKAWARHRDARTAAIKEFLMGVKVIKLNAFEDYYQQNIQRLRDVEVVWQRWRYTLGTLFNILADQLPIFAMLVTFFFHTKILHRPLEPATAFVALGVFNRVKDSLSTLPNAVNALLNTNVALGRLSSYLNQAEIDDTTWDTSDPTIILKGATLGWPTVGVKGKEAVDAAVFKLRDLNLTIPVGKLTLISGPLGSGKTLLLRGLLGEARVEEGVVQSPRSTFDAVPIDARSLQGPWTNETWLSDSVAYAPQQSFIQHGTIRDNILFGQPMWRERYQEVLRQSCLLADLKLMPDGDRTEVGAKGVNLSGGQKARINLARCLYSRAKTVYMDDILSAVDAHTSGFLVSECLAGELFKGRTVVLVTHHVGLCLPVFDYLISLRNGTIQQACPTSEITMSRIQSESFAPADREAETEEELDPLENTQLPEEGAEETTHHARVIYASEKTGAGSLDRSHYLFVLAAAGGLGYWFVLASVYLGTRGMDIARSLWLRHWSSDTDPRDLDYNLGVYAVIVTTSVTAGALRWVVLYGVGKVGFYNRGSRIMHEQLLAKICAAPLAFFDSTPSGRIMNIFGQDFNTLDSASADNFGNTVTTTLDVASSAIIICLQAPFLLIYLLAFALPFYWISKILRKLRADIRRLGATAGSPLISLYHDMVDGVVMVRAFGSTQLMCATMIALINRERQTTLSDYTIFNWVRAVIQSLTSIIVTATGFYLVNQDISPAQAGFILSFAVTTSQGLYTLLSVVSGLEQVFVSAERVNHYVTMPMTESTEGKTPPPGWPSKGKVSFKNLCVTYAPDLPDVLHDISFDIEPGMRVGVVGSTGSGKSTLALTLFRGMEPREGTIEIDGEDIRQVKLKELRKSLNIVVQDGSLNSGTLRDALDITRSKDDWELFDALRRVHLLPEGSDPKELVGNPFANLDTFVAVEGANFSHGQRQILCLARALLRKSKILVMDEATSSVDFEMDAKITATIKECFADTTMIVIAHRLATVMHYDRVLVLNRGVVAEYDSPRKLMLEEGSAFRGLCMVQGKAEFDRLMDMTGTV